MRYLTDWPQQSGRSGQVVDLSPAGMCFECAEPHQIYWIIKIECDALDATARVVRCTRLDGAVEPRHSIGVEFYTLEFRSPRGTFLSTMG